MTKENTSAPAAENKMGTMPIGKLLFNMSLPMMISMLVQALYNIVDSIFVAKLSENALTAVSLAFPLQTLLIAVATGTGVGMNALLSRSLGEHKFKEANKIGVNAAFLYFLSYLVFLILGFTVVKPFYASQIKGADAEIMEMGIEYLRTVMIFSFGLLAQIYFERLLTSTGKTLFSMTSQLCGALTNIILDPIMIFGLLGCPALGIVGAAVATLCARIAELVIVLIYARRKDHQVHLRFRNLFVKDPVLFKDFLHYALPVILNELMWGAGFSMNSVIIGHLGSPAVAANSVAQVTRNLATVVAFGIANATAILVGRTIGEGDVKRAEVYAKRFVRLTLCAGAAAAAVVLLVLPIMHKVMTLSEQAHSYLTVMMLVMSYFVFLQAYNTTMVVGIFRAGGDTRLGLIIDVSTMWGGSILFGALCAFVLKLPVEAVYVVLMSDEVIKVPITTLRYRQKKWLKNVTREL